MSTPGSYSYPWDELTEQQQTARCDEILRRPGDFFYNIERDSFRSKDASGKSHDYAPGAAVEERRKTIDGERPDMPHLEFER